MIMNGRAYDVWSVNVEDEYLEEGELVVTVLDGVPPILTDAEV
jgi:hypothetical protein